ncbi:MAG: LamG domain-containing protein [Candidatus Schekmanbacteria bacterium]|nr:LamG domain-containing protein [Candidatus Schekmanbacteria bacterium]
MNRSKISSPTGITRGISYAACALLSLMPGASDAETAVNRVWCRNGQAGTQSVPCTALDAAALLNEVIAGRLEPPGPVSASPASLSDAGKQRVTEGLVALYTFTEGGGALVHDVANVGPPIDLSISNPANVIWLFPQGLLIKAPVLIASPGPATGITAQCTATSAITVEVWVLPDDDQTGPARIVSLSQDPYLRNFTLAQEGSAYDFRLRTTETSENGFPSLASPNGAVLDGFAHLVYRRDTEGIAVFFQNSIPISAGVADGNLSNWSGSFRMALGNELTGDRPWQGWLLLVAIYSRALTRAEIEQNFNAGISDVAVPLYGGISALVALGVVAATVRRLSRRRGAGW